MAEQCVYCGADHQPTAAEKEFFEQLYPGLRESGEAVTVCNACFTEIARLGCRALSDAQGYDKDGHVRVAPRDFPRRRCRRA